MQSKELFLSIYDFSPKCDPWGTAMSAMFDVAGEMYNRSIPIPAEWKYRPGMGDPLIEDEYTRQQIEALDDETLSKLGDYLHRVTNALDRAGKSY